MAIGLLFGVGILYSTSPFAEKLRIWLPNSSVPQIPVPLPAFRNIGKAASS